MDEKPGNVAPKPQRKMKFMPKAPPRREQKLVLPKPEKVEEAETDDAKAQELLRRFNEASNKPKFKQETKPSQTRISPFNFGPSLSGGPSSMKTRSSYPTARSEAGLGASMMEEEYKEPWDYYKYYPVTLPARMPYSGNPEVLDEQEFGEGSETMNYNEFSAKSAEELGLTEEDLEQKLIFFQLPSIMPVPKDKGGSSAKACNLKEMPAGYMGKLLVYKSGKVKMKLGDHLYDFH